jgi:hypothetical protein
VTNKDPERDLLTLGIDTDASTVWPRLLEVGQKARKPIKKQLLTPMKQKRLAWASKYTSWATDDWKKVAYGDNHIFLFQVIEQVLSDKAVMNL